MIVALTLVLGRPMYLLEIFISWIAMTLDIKEPMASSWYLKLILSIFKKLFSSRISFCEGIMHWVKIIRIKSKTNSGNPRCLETIWKGRRRSTQWVGRELQNHTDHAAIFWMNNKDRPYLQLLVLFITLASQLRPRKETTHEAIPCRIKLLVTYLASLNIFFTFGPER